jgi:predicted DNA-binding transcriptional regulator AlpA
MADEKSGNRLERLLDELAVAELLDVSASLLGQWRRKGGGPPFIQMGSKTVKYDPADIRRWLNEHKKVAGA